MKYFKIKISDLPPGIIQGSNDVTKTNCIVSVSSAADIEALEVKGTELTKSAARTLRIQWDEDFPVPS